MSSQPNTLAEIQAKVKAPKGQFNSFGKYAYRSAEDILESVKQVVNPLGFSISLSDTIVMIGDRFYVQATATLTNGKETYTATAFAREEESKKGMDGSQVTGASSSYSRKYALNGLFALDDTKDSDATNTHGKEETKPMSMNMQSWTDGLNACKTIEQLQALYRQKESIIIANKEVLALFTAKKLSLTQNNN
jgi:hypothetical protein